jgi:hypothetical protein
MIQVTRHRSDQSRFSFTAFFALDSEVEEPGFGQVPHRNSMGKYKATIRKD